MKNSSCRETGNQRILEKNLWLISTAEMKLFHLIQGLCPCIPVEAALIVYSKDQPSMEEVTMSHENILIIENDEIVANSLEKTLLSYDYTVTGVASSGKNALSIVQEMPVDLVLMDSVLNGPYDVVTTVNGILSFIDIPIIYLIPQDNYDLIFRAKNRLPNRFLTKPVDEKNLLAIIRRALIYHAWGTIPTENLSQCYTRYEEAVCTCGKEKDSYRIRNKCLSPPF
jgi:CheY-like chemotaxis protein